VEPDIIREAAEQGTIPQRKGGRTEDTEEKMFSASFAGSKKTVSSVASFYICDLCGIVTQFPRTIAMVYLSRYRIFKYSKALKERG
jgi:hypothetical protein